MSVLFILLESGIRLWALGLLLLAGLLLPSEADGISSFARLVLDYILAASALCLISHQLAHWWSGPPKR